MKSCSTRRVLGLLVALGCALSAGCGGSSQYASPEATFDAAKAAAAKEDYKQFAECMTAEAQEELAAGLVIASAFMQLAGLGEGPEAAKGKEAADQLKAILEKHGVKEDAMDESKPEPGAGEEDDKTAMRKLAAPIKDRPAFIGDVLGVLTKMKGEGGKPLEGDAKLTDLKTEGDSATATVVQTRNGKERKDQIQFRKVDGKWKIAEIPGGPK